MTCIRFHHYQWLSASVKPTSLQLWFRVLLLGEWMGSCAVRNSYRTTNLLLWILQ